MAVRFGTAFDHEMRDAKIPGKHLQQARDVKLRAGRDNVRDAISRKFGQMAIGNISTHKNDDVVAAQLRALKVKLPGRVERNGERGSICRSNVDRSFSLPWPGWRMGAGPAHLRHSDTPDQPGVRLEGGMNFLVLPGPVAPRTIGTGGEATGM